MPGEVEILTCHWRSDADMCGMEFDDPEVLHDHLSTVHVGRAQTGNLCLTCHWDACTHTCPFTKRDHIVSHLKRHVPLKTFVCEVVFHLCRDAITRSNGSKTSINTLAEQAMELRKRCRDRNALLQILMWL